MLELPSISSSESTPPSVRLVQDPSEVELESASLASLSSSEEDASRPAPMMVLLLELSWPSNLWNRKFPEGETPSISRSGQLLEVQCDCRISRNNIRHWQTYWRILAKGRRLIGMPSQNKTGQNWDRTPFEREMRWLLYEPFSSLGDGAKTGWCCGRLLSKSDHSCRESNEIMAYCSRGATM